jgi:hypothetical protein
MMPHLLKSLRCICQRTDLFHMEKHAGAACDMMLMATMRLWTVAGPAPQLSPTNWLWLLCT